MHALIYLAREVIPKLPGDLQGHFSELLNDAQAIARQGTESGWWQEPWVLLLLQEDMPG